MMTLVSLLIWCLSSCILCFVSVVFLCYQSLIIISIIVPFSFWVRCSSIAAAWILEIASWSSLATSMASKSLTLMIGSGICSTLASFTCGAFSWIAVFDRIFINHGANARLVWQLWLTILLWFSSGRRGCGRAFSRRTAIRRFSSVFGFLLRVRFLGRNLKFLWVFLDFFLVGNLLGTWSQSALIVCLFLWLLLPFGRRRVTLSCLFRVAAGWVFLWTIGCLLDLSCLHL